MKFKKSNQIDLSSQYDDRPMTIERESPSMKHPNRSWLRQNHMLNMSM